MAFPVSMFRQVVVIEVIDDAQRYSLLTPEELSNLFESKKSKEPEKSGGIFSVFNSTNSAAYEVLKKQILCCPKNSIVGLDVTANENDGVVPRIYYPFFQSHFFQTQEKMKKSCYLSHHQRQCVKDTGCLGSAFPAMRRTLISLMLTALNHLLISRNRLLKKEGQK